MAADTTRRAFLLGRFFAFSGCQDRGSGLTEDQARMQALVRREFGAGPIRPEDITLVGPPIISESARRKQAEGRLWAEGYTRAELDRAQAKYGLPFPPDLVALFLKRRPVLGWDWRSEESEIRTMLARP